MSFEIHRREGWDVRAAAARFIAAYFPSDYGDEWFADLLNGRWQPGGGTTCTFPPHRMLNLLGCRDNRLVNFDSDDGLTRWEMGAGGGLGVSKLYYGAKAVGCWVDDGHGREPSHGDIYFVSNGPPATEHVGIVIDPAVWESADAGQKNEHGHEAARIVRRNVDDRRASGGPRLLSAPLNERGLPSGGDMRKLMGWIDLSLAPFAADPSGVCAEPADAPGAFSPVQAIGAVAVGLSLLALLGVAAYDVSKGPARPSVSTR